MAPTVLSACAVPVDESEGSAGELRADGVDSDPQAVGGVGVNGGEFRHPLQFAPRVGEKIALFEAKDSATGKRFSVQEFTSIAHEGAEPVHNSGVVELTAGRLSESMEKLLSSAKGPAESHVEVRRRVSRRLQTLLNVGAQAEPLNLVILVRKSGVGDIPHALEYAIARGEVNSLRDRDSKRAELLREKRSRIASVLVPVAEQAKKLGAEIKEVGRLAHYLRVPVARSVVPQLLEIPQVSAIDVDYAQEERVNWYTDGFIGGTSMQVTPLWSAGYNGEYGSNTDLAAGLHEWEGIESNHLGYRNGSGSSTRLKGLFLCDVNSPGCYQVQTMSYPGTHAMFTTGSLMGDFADGQDPAITDSVERLRRSGYAPESQLYFYHVAAGGDVFSAWANAAEQTPKPHVFSISAGWGGMAGAMPSSEGCNGDTLGERMLDENLYENGVLPVVAAGNNGGFYYPIGGRPTPVCTLGDPASALGALTIAGYGIANDYSICNQREHPIAAPSSRGGISWEQGRHRSIVDLAGPYFQNWRMGPGGITNVASGGTSGSAPAVAGIALCVVDNHKSLGGSTVLLDSPGLLHALMLLMGDRAGVDSSGNLEQLLSGFDNRFGAGRVKVQGRGTGADSDSPTYISYGWTCIDHKQTVSINVNMTGSVHSPVSSDVEFGKAVIWWYDRRFDDTTELDDIDLSMRDATSNLLLSTSASSREEKERVSSWSVGGRRIRLDIHGYNVTADHEGCGTNSMKVYYAYRFEDNDRDDFDGPNYNSSSCVGVEPERQ